MSLISISKLLATAIAHCSTDDEISAEIVKTVERHTDFFKGIGTDLDKSIPGFSLITTIGKGLTQALAPEIMGGLVEKIEYNKMREYLVTPNPKDLNHDLSKLLKKAALTSLGYIKSLWFEKLKQAEDDEQRKLLEGVFKQMKADLTSWLAYETIEDDILKDPSDCLSAITDYIFTTSSVNRDSEFAEFFVDILPFCFKLAYKEALKDDDNKKAFIAFQIWILQSIDHKTNRINQNTVEILDRLAELTIIVNQQRAKPIIEIVEKEVIREIIVEKEIVKEVIVEKESVIEFESVFLKWSNAFEDSNILSHFGNLFRYDIEEEKSLLAENLELSYDSLFLKTKLKSYNSKFYKLSQLRASLYAKVLTSIDDFDDRVCWEIVDRALMNMPVDSNADILKEIHNVATCTKDTKIFWGLIIDFMLGNSILYIENKNIIPLKKYVQDNLIIQDKTAFQTIIHELQSEIVIKRVFASFKVTEWAANLKIEPYEATEFYYPILQNLYEMLARNCISDKLSAIYTLIQLVEIPHFNNTNGKIILENQHHKILELLSTDLQSPKLIELTCRLLGKVFHVNYDF
jgi:hypothetical protein